MEEGEGGAESGAVPDAARMAALVAGLTEAERAILLDLLAAPAGPS